MKTRIACLALSTLLSGIVVAEAAEENPAYMQPRIVGGVSASISSAPSTVALLNTRILQQTGSYFASQFCGGTVIDDRWVLTAAHCLFDGATVVGADDVLVLMGSGDLENPINQPVGVTRVVTHPGYSNDSVANDIALLRLEYDALVPTAELDNQNIELNDDGLIVGWGAVNEGGNGVPQYFPTGLRSAVVKMIPGEQCEEMFPVYDGVVSSTNLCAGSPEGGVDTCQGDSGGPLYRMLTSASRTLTLVGVTSFGMGCGGRMAPGVYASVGAYRSWIQATVNQANELALTLAGDMPSNDDPVPFVVAAATARESGAGSLSWWVGLLALVAIFRRRKARNILTAVIAGNVVFCVQVVQACAMGVNMDSAISSAQQTIGRSRDLVLSSEPFVSALSHSCSVERTGYGMSKRAYFLESCLLVHENSPICGEAPSSLEYVFFEEKLVRISYDFESVVNTQSFHACLNSSYFDMLKEDMQIKNRETPFSVVVEDIEKVRNIQRLHSEIGKTILARIGLS